MLNQKELVNLVDKQLRQSLEGYEELDETVLEWLKERTFNIFHKQYNDHSAVAADKFLIGCCEFIAYFYKTICDGHTPDHDDTLYVSEFVPLD